MARKKFDLNTKKFLVSRGAIQNSTQKQEILWIAKGAKPTFRWPKKICINHFSTYPQNVCKLRSTLTDKYKNYVPPKKIWKKLFGTIAEKYIYNWLFYIYFITKIYYYFFACALLSSFSFQNGCLANIMFDLCHAELFPRNNILKLLFFGRMKDMCLNLKNVCLHKVGLWLILNGLWSFPFSCFYWIWNIFHGNLILLYDMAEKHSNK